MKLTLGMLAIVPMYILLLITSLIARTMAVVSAILASACIATVFWTKSEKLIAYAKEKFGI
jgi:hypothetical protein